MNSLLLDEILGVSWRLDQWRWLRETWVWLSCVHTRLLDCSTQLMFLFWGPGETGPNGAIRTSWHEVCALQTNRELLSYARQHRYTWRWGGRQDWNVWFVLHLFWFVLIYWTSDFNTLIYHGNNGVFFLLLAFTFLLAITVLFCSIKWGATITCLSLFLRKWRQNNNALRVNYGCF